jgi:hypothetical protein
MKGKFQFIKNIILVVASALTLVAVTFAWFTSNFETKIDSYQQAISGETLKVDFYQADESEKYQPLSGDIELNDFVPGKFNKYKFEITTKTADKLKMSFAIEDLGADIPQELKDNVGIKYSVYKLSKKVSANGNVAYINSTQITYSNGYVKLSDLEDGKIFSGLSLANHQTAAGDKFAIYYEIGLSEEAPDTIGGMESSLGNIKISAQRIG